MCQYGSVTLKPQYAYANSKMIRKLDQGPVSATKKEELKATAPKTAESYVDQHGVKRWTGTPYLKQTEKLGKQWFCCLRVIGALLHVVNVD